MSSPCPLRPAAELKCKVRAFTLIELLVVMAILAITLVILVPAFTGMGRANALTANGNQVVSLANLARQNSMSKNVMTALLVVTDQNLGENGRLLTLFEMTPKNDGGVGQWKQISNWEVLDDRIIAAECTFVDSSTQPFPAFPDKITYGDKVLGSYRYVVFLPNGSLLNDQSSHIRLVEGAFPPGSSTPIFTGPKSGNGAANSYNITLLSTTGRAKVDRS